MARFKDRKSAALELLPKLHKFSGDVNCVVVGLPRGGMITAYEIAKGLDLPLGFLIVKKISAPNNAELAIGAVTDNGGIYLDKALISSSNIADSWVESEKEKKREEAIVRADYYSEYYKNPELKGKTVILVDDGMATGATMIAAARSVVRHGARKVVISVPEGPCDNFDKMRAESDEIICLGEDLKVSSVGEYYDEFPEVTDKQVKEILQNAKNNSDNK